MSSRVCAKMASVLGESLSVEDLDALGKRCGQSKRLRVVTPFRLALSLLVALGQGTAESIADLCREFNFLNGTTTAHKAFYNRLARPSFAKFMRALAMRLMGRLVMQMLAPKADGPLARFEDIIIQDGSSFALKRTLKCSKSGSPTPTYASSIQPTRTSPVASFGRAWRRR